MSEYLSSTRSASCSASSSQASPVISLPQPSHPTPMCTTSAPITEALPKTGIYKKILYNLREFWKGLCSDQIGGQVFKTFKKPLSFKDLLKKTLGRLLTLFSLSFPVAYACILVF